MINPLKALLFLAGGTAVAGAGAYVSGALDPFLNPPPQPAAIANLPADGGTPPAAGGEAAPKEDRVEITDKPATEQPAATGQPAASDQPAAADQKTGNPEVAALDPQAPVAQTVPETNAPVAGEPQPAAPVAGAIIPTFDLVRVEGDGSMVIAGKAAPNAKVELLTGGNVIGAATAGAAGDFVVVLDKPLAPGDYQITILATNADGSTANSVQTAIVSVPKDASGQVLAMIEEPGKPSEIITVPQPVAAAAESAKPEPKPDEQPAEEVAAADAKPVDQPGVIDPAQPEAVPPAAGAQPEPPATGTEVAAADPKPEEPAATAQPAAPTMDLAVEAVEIDGAKIFVAGRAAAGSTIRVYANEFMLGETKSSAAGRFLVEAERDLPVGSYIVRADVMAPDGVQVLARAAVPFEREPGENIAAVAPAAAGPAQADPKPAETAVPTATAGAQPPAAEQPAAPAAADARPASEPQPPAGGEAATPPAVAEANPPAVGEEKPTTEGAATPPVTAEARPDATEQPAATAQPTATAEAQPPAATQEPAASVDQKPAEVAAVAPPAEVTAPALQNVNSAVIIRRGDSLWRISKRVYGRGTRYATIYLANQDQIRDPDMIWPGQVFGVPEKTQEGETADMTKMGEQATTKAQ